MEKLTVGSQFIHWFTQYSQHAAEHLGLTHQWAKYTPRDPAGRGRLCHQEQWMLSSPENYKRGARKNRKSLLRGSWKYYKGTTCLRGQAACFSNFKIYFIHLSNKLLFFISLFVYILILCVYVYVSAQVPQCLHPLNLYCFFILWAGNGGVGRNIKETWFCRFRSSQYAHV